MPLDLYRRHADDCKFASKGQNYTKCACVIWVYGSINGRPIRRSLKTRDWSRAMARMNTLESQPEAKAPTETIHQAVKRYLEDCAARKLAESTLISYRNVLEPFAEHCDRRAVRELTGLRLEEFRSFREARKVAATTQRKEIEHLRAFCRFCLEHDWIQKNFAARLKPPDDPPPITMPYESDEIQKLLAACDRITNNYEPNAARARLRARALILLLLYSGLRVSDAVRLKRSQLAADGRLMLRAMKTGTALYVRLQTDCVEALRVLPIESEYFLWSGRGKVTSATGSARRTVECVSRIAGVSARPHRFRDTFAVELLANGEDIRTVQLLLGHSSIRTTEKHYAPYVARFQERLDAATSKLHFGPNQSA